MRFTVEVHGIDELDVEEMSLVIYNGLTEEYGWRALTDGSVTFAVKEEAE